MTSPHNYGLKDGHTMKRMMNVWLAAMIFAAISSLSLSAQAPAASPASGSISSAQPAAQPEPSLGNYARALKKEKKQESAKKFDNDNLPREDKLSVVGPAQNANAAADQLPSADNATAAQHPANPSVTPGESQEQRQQVYDQWKQKLSGQQDQIDLLSRELDVEQKEYKLKAASFYGDAGERLRNQSGWDKEDAAYKQKLADKQKALDDAKQKLGDMQEDARKAGVPTSVREGDQPDQKPPQQPQ